MEQKLSEAEWKKSTVYTMLKRMEEKKAIINQDAVVTPQLPKKEALKIESDDVRERTFSGSVTNFFAAFLQGSKDYEGRCR